MTGEYVEQSHVNIGDPITASGENTSRDNVHAFWRNAVAGGIPYWSAANTIAALAKPSVWGLLRNYASGIPSYFTPGGANYVLRSNGLNTDLDSFPLFAMTSVGRAGAYSVSASGTYLSWDTEYVDELNAWGAGSPSALLTASGKYQYCLAQVGIRVDTSVNYVLGELLFTSGGSTIRAGKCKTGPVSNNVPVFFQIQSFPVSAGGYFQLYLTVDGGTDHTGLVGLDNTWMILYQIR
jgi:hypothetical protein